jgi:hypothetical protein
MSKAKPALQYGALCEILAKLMISHVPVHVWQELNSRAVSSNVYKIFKMLMSRRPWAYV